MDNLHLICFHHGDQKFRVSTDMHVYCGTNGARD